MRTLTHEYWIIEYQVLHMQRKVHKNYDEKKAVKKENNARIGTLITCYLSENMLYAPLTFRLNLSPRQSTYAIHSNFFFVHVFILLFFRFNSLLFMKTRVDNHGVPYALP